MAEIRLWAALDHFLAFGKVCWKIQTVSPGREEEAREAVGRERERKGERKSKGKGREGGKRKETFKRKDRKAISMNALTPTRPEPRLRLLAHYFSRLLF